MTRKLITFMILIASINTCCGQASFSDSLKQELNKTKNDTVKISLVSALSVYYQQLKPDSSNRYSEILLQISRKLGYRITEAFALSRMAYALLDLGQYPKSLQTIHEGVKLAEDPANEKNILPEQYASSEEYHELALTPRMHRLNALADLFQVEGILYSNMNNSRKELELDSQVMDLIRQTGNLRLKCRTQITMGIAYSRLGSLNSALLVLDSAYDLASKLNFKRFVSSILLNTGRIYRTMHDNEKAAGYFREAIKAGQVEYPRGVAAASIDNGGLFSLPANKDSALWYAYNGLETAKKFEAPELIQRAYDLLGKIYRAVGKNDSAVKYMSYLIGIKDTLFNVKQGQQFQNIQFAQQQKEQELLNAQKSYKNRLVLYAVLTWAAIFLIIATILWRNNRNKQKDYALLQRQKQETDNQKNKAETTLKELRATQAQLIQSEKMASLGEMSAGIAHEIQNPLNFVNNFSELNAELISELKSGLQQESLSPSGSRLSSDILQNLEENSKKITHHGKRADAIVKGMLQHSNLDAAKKELSDINELTREYLKFCYHSYRLKDKNFNCEFETHLDADPADIFIVAQDLGRVLLNLFNNSFYAMATKKKEQAYYNPVLKVRTALFENCIEIIIRDNGPGIPEKIREKIFQPFFTTKPAGQGTGLGLSLSYDIITKEHDGMISVESKEGEYAEFVIRLPLNDLSSQD
jgi:two-component system, NtrC family, sensor kinase